MAALLYGAFCYIVFLLTFLYAIGFGSKESAITLPGLVLLVDAARERSESAIEPCRAKTAHPRFAPVSTLDDTLGYITARSYFVTQCATYSAFNTFPEP